MQATYIPSEELDSLLNLVDLSDPRCGPHAMQVLVEQAHQALADLWGCPRLVYRRTPVVSVSENYDDLGYPPGGAARERRYTRYLSKNLLLRTQTSAAMPPLLRALALSPPQDLLVVVPGLVYRRDVVDRWHVGEPHQMDLWRLKLGSLTAADLQQMIELVMTSLLPGLRYQVTAADHSYTVGGYQIDAWSQGQWVEVGECGLISPRLLERTGHDPKVVSGLAMGLGLDRLLMLRKGIADIRLLRASEPRIAQQMLDLQPYRPVSKQPPVVRDLSLSVPSDLSAEELGDYLRTALGEAIDLLESAEVLSETPYADLPAAAHQRMGMVPDQKNILLRLQIRHPSRTLTREEANSLRDKVYRLLHKGRASELIG